MKKILLFVAIMLCCAMSIFAQNDKISYQAVVRDTTNRLVANQTVTVTVNIFNGEETTAVYSETHENVQTNVNGLISLLIGPDQTDDAWNSIQWANARVETKVTLDGVLLGTLVMPLTAVPYALYADEINPAGTVVTNIYNKMQRDSIALAEKMRADSTVIRNALSDSTSAVRDALADSTSAVRSALVDSTSAVRTALVDSVTNINTRVETTAETLHNEINTLETNVTNRMNTISDSVKTTLDSVTTVSTTLHNEITAVSTDMQTNYAKLAGDNTFTGDNTFSGNSTFSGTVTAGTVNASAVNVTCGNDHISMCDLLDSCRALSGRVNNLTNQISSLNNTISTLQGQIEELEELKQALSPSFSGSPTFSEITPTSMRVTVNASNITGEITSYNFCIATNENMSGKVCHTSTNPTYNFTNLAPNTTYYVTVSATNFAGTTTSSPVVHQKTYNPTMSLSGDATAIFCSGSKSVNYTATVSVNNQTVSANDFNYSWSATGSTSRPGNTNSGAVVYNGAGTKTVTVTATHKTQGYTVTATRNTTLNQGVTSITLNKTSMLLHYNNGTQTLTKTANPSNAASTTYSWTSNNSGVATVANGVVTAHAKGTATITVAANDGCGASKTCVVETGVDLSTLTSDYTAQNNDILFGTLDGSAHVIKITIADNATVRLHNANINGGTSGDWAGLTCNNATITLDQGTNNVVIGFMNGNAGIHVKPGYTLTINGSGSLHASTHGGGAGIGCGYGTCASRDGGNIVINGGVITAEGGNLGAGIGSGGRAVIGNITINGGTIDAQGGGSAAGIGCGQSNQGGSTCPYPAKCGNITIANTANVTAKKGSGAAHSIGKGSNPGQATCGTLTIGGSTTDYISTSPYTNH